MHLDQIAYDADRASTASLAADLLQALARGSRLRVLAAALGLADDTGSCGLAELADFTGREQRALVEDLVRLQAGGLVTLSGRSVRVDLTVLTGTADALNATHPVSRLLAEEPDLTRFFRHGRLVRIPEDDAVTSRIAAVLVELLPTGVSLSEAEVNRCLGQVTDDHAWLRRLLTDEGLLERGASRDYRRR